jgi:hypothetical protein
VTRRVGDIPGSSGTAGNAAATPKSACSSRACVATVLPDYQVSLPTDAGIDGVEVAPHEEGFLRCRFADVEPTPLKTLYEKCELIRSRVNHQVSVLRRPRNGIVGACD